MGLTILHSADWHLDTAFASHPEKRRKRLKQELRKVPGRILELVQSHHPDLVLLSGDLLDGKGTPESVELLRHTLRQMQVPVFISPGNHDFCAPGSAWVEESWPENVHIFTSGLEHVVLPELGCRVYGAGYQSMDCPPLLQDFRAEGEETYCVAVLHGDPVVRNSPCCAITAAQVRESGLDYLALGHIHKAGSFRAGDTLCAWPGAPMGRGWDETGDKGVLLVTLTDTSEVKTISLDVPRFFDLEVEVEEEPRLSLEAALPAAGSEDFYRIVLTGTGAPDLKKLYQQFAHFPNLELYDRTEPPVPLWTDMEGDSLRTTYFRLLQQSGSSHAELAARISQRLLSGKEVQLP